MRNLHILAATLALCAENAELRRLAAAIETDLTEPAHRREWAKQLLNPTPDTMPTRAGSGSAPSIEAAQAMGENGGAVVEDERIAFEAWMHGHNWMLCAKWNGITYIGDTETHSRLCQDAIRTRQLWAAWRDRAALARNG